MTFENIKGRNYARTMNLDMASPISLIFGEIVELKMYNRLRVLIQVITNAFFLPFLGVFLEK